MLILVLQGPNLNLLGFRSSQAGGRITLDKVTRALRRHAREKAVTLKMLQTHKVDLALPFLHRHRNLAAGLLFAPLSWAHYEYSLRDALRLVQIPTVQVLLSAEYSPDITQAGSIYSDLCRNTVIGPPETVFIQGLDVLLDGLV